MFSIQLTNCIWCLSHLFLLQSTPLPLPPGQCAGGTHPTGMHSCFSWVIGGNSPYGVAPQKSNKIRKLMDDKISLFYTLVVLKWYEYE